MARQSEADSLFFDMSSSKVDIQEEDTSIPTTAHEQAKSRTTYASFGAGGVTATTNAYGHLLQITRYAGNEPSCFVCADLPEMPLPSSIAEHLAALQSNIERDDVGMRLMIDDKSSDNAWKVKESIPKMKFHHDRWPCFTTETTDFKLKIEYFVNKDTVYQSYTYALKTPSTGIKDFPKLMINNKVRIRDLVFLKNYNPSKRDDPPQDNPPQEVSTQHDSTQHDSTQHDSTQHDSTQRTNEICIIRKRKFGQRKELIVTFSARSFINELPQSFIHNEIRPDKTMKQYLKEKNVMRITIAYTLGISQNNAANITPSLISESRETLGQIVDIPPNDPFNIPSFTSDPHLNFAMRRNLEHILSVCSIPIDNPPDGVPCIALTCGDISGHRITTESSFYAFQFLLKALSHYITQGECHDFKLQNSSCMNYNCLMRSRIWKVCFGHIKWVCNKIEGKREGFIPPHYWANGKEIKDWNKHTVLRGKSLTDTPFQIIKVADFCQKFGDKEVPKIVTKGLGILIGNWIKKLDERNKSGKYAFPHFREEPSHLFYLSDHVLIWKAIKSLENLKLAPGLRRKFTRYLSSKVKSNIISRFTTTTTTTDDLSSKQRMLAVSRSPSENCFLFQPKDTVLFYAMEMGLFDKPGMAVDKFSIWDNKIDVWRSIVDCQVQHEDNQDVHWTSPLQFALALMLSARGKALNSRPAPELYIYSKRILSACSSANGLFPGCLDENKEPAIFSNGSRSETYWYTTFEVPYILWNYGRPPSRKGALFEDSMNTSRTRVTKSTTSNIKLGKILERLNDMAIPNSSINKEYSTMERSVLSNSVMDRGKIVQLSDEWMYNEPNCFKSNIDLSHVAIRGFCRNYEETPYMAVINNGVKEVLFPLRFNFGKSILGYIIDVAKKSDKEPNTHTPEITSNDGLSHLLQGRRTPEISKKRFLHFCRATTKTALLCYLAASEHQEVSDFFDRHKAYYKYFHDEATVVLNLWVTEIHLSFYQLLQPKTQAEIDDIAGIPQFAHFEFPHLKEEGKSKSKWISRAAMSFRFDGDSFDRYWTCHFFEFNPRLMGIQHLSDIREEAISGSLKTHPWKQRRILELILFERILREMVKCSQEILEEIKERILEGFNRPKSTETSATFLDAFDLFTNITSNTFLSTSKSWNKLQYILQAVEEDIRDNLTTIDLWIEREEKRGHDRPRWTINDERNYRGAISRLQKSNNLLVQDLRLCYARARSFNQSLTRRLESARNEWEVGSNNDIRLFTYVTVVFLPISFATGVFSMSSTPTKETLNSMITTAGLALLVTVMALLNAKVLERKIGKPFFDNFRPISEVILWLVLRSPLYIFGLLFRLAHLILVSILSILPGKWLYLLRRYLISSTEESSSRLYDVTNAPKKFLNKEIKGKIEQIKDKLVNEQDKIEWRKAKTRSLEGWKDIV